MACRQIAERLGTPVEVLLEIATAGLPLCRGGDAWHLADADGGTIPSDFLIR